MKMDICHIKDDSYADISVYVTKAIAGALPLVGGLVAEFIGHVVPNQRIERIVRFLELLEERMQAVEGVILTRERFQEESFCDFFEECIRQSVGVLSQERRENLVNLVVKGVSVEGVELMRIKFLLKTLANVNDAEITILTNYFYIMWYGAAGKGALFYETHKNILEAAFAVPYDGSPMNESIATCEGYKEHLLSLGLLERSDFVRYGHDSKHPPGNPGDSRKKYQITTFGKQFLKYIGVADDERERKEINEQE
jgi:hypothetical protein